MLQLLFTGLLLIDTISNFFFSNPYQHPYFIFKSKEVINYKYDRAAQVLDYSGNWDFDKDGQKDGLLFIGTGGAHLYYYLRIVLSSDSMARNYTSLNLDNPILHIQEGNPKMDPVNLLHQFTVLDIDNDVQEEILLLLDRFSRGSPWLNKQGIDSDSVVVRFESKEVSFFDYSDVK
jgi:hypothetical protein